MVMEYLKVANILAPVGLKGEMKVYTTSTNKDLRYKKNSVLIIDDELKSEVHIEYYREKEKNIDILKFKEINSREDVEKLLKKDLLVIKDSKDLRKDEFFYTDLVSLECFDESNNYLGKIVKVLDYTGIINFSIEKENKKTVNVPFNDFFVKDVSLENKKVIIHTIEGLFDEN